MSIGATIYYLNLVCTNGHVAHLANRNKVPEPQKFCTECGSELLSKCPSCNTDFKGLNASGFNRPEFCHECGKPFPWQGKPKE